MVGDPLNLGGAAGRDLDPDIRRFVDAVSRAFAAYPQFDHLPFPRRRAIAEEVRAPWTRGGPTMARRIDSTIPTRHGEMRIRIHAPSVGASKPGFVYLHGGGWTLFSIDTHDRLMREYAARTDMVVVGLDYALAPEHRFPVALEQVIDAVHWLQQHGSKFHIDASRLAIGGDSAGGNLALATCIALREAGEADAFRAMVLNYAAIDSTCSEEALRRYGGQGYMLAGEEMSEFWRNYAGSGVPENTLLCPLHADLRGLPPAFLVIAACDILAEQNEQLAAKLRAANVPTDAVVYLGASHSFLEAASIAELSRRALDETSAWLRKTLGCGD